MIIFGTRNKKIKEYEDELLVCEFCGKPGLKFSVYRHCVHVFWIPVFPVGSKSIECTCGNCGAQCAGAGKKNGYLSRTGTPAYMFTIFIFLFVLIIVASVLNIHNGRKKIEYINDPKPGDVYLIRDEGGNVLKYYFLKVEAVNEESVIVYHNVMTYDKFVTKMAPQDYFVTDDETEIFKEDLKEYLDKGIINSAKRNYGSSSNFTNEDIR